MSAVVIDNGTGVVKAGRAGADSPSVQLANVVGRPKHVRVMSGGSLGASPVMGPRVPTHRGALSLHHPMERGAVAPGAWEDMEHIWRYLFGPTSDGGLGLDPHDQPVLLTEAPLTPAAHTRRSAEVMFESLGVAALHTAAPAVLTLYSAGQTTGLVVDSGEGLTSVVPVYEGHAVGGGAVQQLQLAGVDVTHALRSHLRRASFVVAGPTSGDRGRRLPSPPPGSSASASCVWYGEALGASLHSSAELELVRDMKEAACVVAPTAPVPMRPGRSARATGFPAQADPPAAGSSLAAECEFRLPDGHRVRLGQERALAAEVLFSPASVGLSEQLGVHEAVAQALRRCEVELRAPLLGSVLLSGGTTCIPGYGKRLFTELQQLTPPGTHIRMSAPATRAISAWIGGSIFASLGTFKSALISKADWEERGGDALYATERL